MPRTTQVAATGLSDETTDNENAWFAMNDKKKTNKILHDLHLNYSSIRCVRWANAPVYKHRSLASKEALFYNYYTPGASPGGHRNHNSS